MKLVRLDFEHERSILFQKLDKEAHPACHSNYPKAYVENTLMDYKQNCI